MSLHNPKEKLLTCPYNAFHQILPHRMSNHLVKCRKNYTDKEFTVCPFNALHHVETHLYQAHIEECDDKKIVDLDLYRARQTNRLQENEDHQQFDPDYATEDWDTETASAAYLPCSSILDKEVMRQPPVGLGKSARVQWRKAEEERVRRLKVGEPINDLIFPTKTGSITVEEMREDRISQKSFFGNKEEDDKDAFCRSLMQAEVPSRKPLIKNAGFPNDEAKDSPSNAIIGPSFGRGRIPFVSSKSDMSRPGSNF